MGLTRLLAIGLILWLGWFIYRRIKQSHVIDKIKTSRNTSKKTPSQIIKKCSVCGLHVPLTEALEADGRYYCCQAHMDKDS